MEAEQKKSQEYQKGVRKYERRIKELSYQVNYQCVCTYNMPHITKAVITSKHCLKSYTIE